MAGRLFQSAFLSIVEEIRRGEEDEIKQFIREKVHEYFEKVYIITVTIIIPWSWRALDKLISSIDELSAAHYNDTLEVNVTSLDVGWTA